MKPFVYGLCIYNYLINGRDMPSEYTDEAPIVAIPYAETLIERGRDYESTIWRELHMIYSSLVSTHPIYRFYE
jgi:hypothetical protein